MDTTEMLALTEQMIKKIANMNKNLDDTFAVVRESVLTIERLGRENEDLRRQIRELEARKVRRQTGELEARKGGINVDRI